MKRELPVIELEETEFIVDVYKNELREKENPENTISFFDMKDNGNGYSFRYSPEIKNMPPFFFSDDDVQIDLIPLVKLDPLGMSEKYGVPDVANKTDFEVMVDEEALYKRMKQGRLPTLDIAGQIFYADARINLLRPKDDFSTQGIEFTAMYDYYLPDRQIYVIPYNPRTHRLEEPDYRKITDYPKDLIAVQFPHESILDPVGWNRQNGLHQFQNLKKTGLKLEFEAKIIPWDKTYLDEIVKKNRNRLSNDGINMNAVKSKPEIPPKRKGRKL